MLHWEEKYLKEQHLSETVTSTTHILLILIYVFFTSRKFFSENITFKTVVYREIDLFE